MTRPLPTPSALPGVNVFAVAERVVAGGAYARFSAHEQTAVCLWVLDRRPAPGQTYQVTILAAPDATLPVDEQAKRMALARDVANRILAGTPPLAGVPLLSAELQGAISAVIGTHRRMQNTGHASLASLNARVDHRAAVGTLENMFQKEVSDGSR